MPKMKNDNKYVSLRFPIVIETWKSDILFYMLLPVTFLVMGLWGWGSMKISLSFFLIFILATIVALSIIPIKHIFNSDIISVTYLMKKTKTVDLEHIMNIKLDKLDGEDIHLENIKIIYKDKQKKMVKSLDISLKHFSDSQEDVLSFFKSNYL